MAALLMTPAILSQNSAMLDKASQASCKTHSYLNQSEKLSTLFDF